MKKQIVTKPKRGRIPLTDRNKVKSVHITIVLTPEDEQKLISRAQRDNRPKAAIARMALEAYLG